MTKKPWPLYLFEHTPEQIAEYERLADLAEKGLLETRPETPEERKRRERLQALPTTTSIQQTGPSTFLVDMKCRCGDRLIFSETASQPWIKHKDDFKEEHKDC